MEYVLIFQSAVLGVIVWLLMVRAGAERKERRELQDQLMAMINVQVQTAVDNANEQSAYYQRQNQMAAREEIFRRTEVIPEEQSTTANVEGL